MNPDLRPLLGHNVRLCPEPRLVEGLPQSISLWWVMAFKAFVLAERLRVVGIYSNAINATAAYKAAAAPVR